MLLLLMLHKYTQRSGAQMQAFQFNFTPAAETNAPISSIGSHKLGGVELVTTQTIGLYSCSSKPSRGSPMTALLQYSLSSTNCLIHCLHISSRTVDLQKLVDTVILLRNFGSLEAKAESSERNQGARGKTPFAG